MKMMERYSEEELKAQTDYCAKIKNYMDHPTYFSPPSFFSEEKCNTYITAIRSPQAQSATDTPEEIRKLKRDKEDNLRYMKAMEDKEIKEANERQEAATGAGS